MSVCMLNVMLRLRCVGDVVCLQKGAQHFEARDGEEYTIQYTYIEGVFLAINTKTFALCACRQI